MRDEKDKPMWGRVDKVGKGTKATYDAEKKTLAFCFNRDAQTTSEQLRVLREKLMKELRDLGYVSRMKYNGEVLVENVEDEDVVLEKVNQKLVIHLNKKLSPEEKEKAASKEPT